MPTMAIRSPRSGLLLLLAGLLATVIAACGSSEDSGSGGGGAAAGGTAKAACTKANLDLATPGQLTVGTDKPAYPPYFTDDDPSNGKGFESAVAYAIARRLGFSRGEVKWTTVPFNSSYAPGPKKFDFDVNEVSITPQRSKVVDFSAPYYTAPQAVIAAKGSPVAGATSLAGIKGAQIGVQIGTTSLDAVRDVIDPSTQPKVFNDSNDVVSSLKAGQVDAVVTDLPTAFYITSAQVPSAKIVGQFDAPGGDTWGALLEKDSALTPCVTKAVNALRTSGRLEQLTKRWMGGAAGAPVLR
jgi:polar amino acid transport system substrate-binding protein